MLTIIKLKFKIVFWTSFKLLLNINIYDVFTMQPVEVDGLRFKNYLVCHYTNICNWSIQFYCCSHLHVTYLTCVPNHVCQPMFSRLLTSLTLIIYIMYAITRCSLLTPCAINTHFSILYFQCFLIEFAPNVVHKACCFKLCSTCAVILAESFQLTPDFVHFFLIIFVSLRISNTEL